jgi:hypothetical protein
MKLIPILFVGGVLHEKNNICDAINSNVNANNNTVI